MATIDKLRQQRDEIDRQIDEAIEADEHLREQRILGEDYEKVVCDKCSGRGSIWEVDPDEEEYEVGCRSCSDRGFLYAQKWDHKGAYYDLKYHEVTANE